MSSPEMDQFNPLAAYRRQIQPRTTWDLPRNAKQDPGHELQNHYGEGIMWDCMELDGMGFLYPRRSMVVFRDGKLVGGDGRVDVKDATRLLEQWEQLMRGN
jgi:hypothetical protein